MKHFEANFDGLVGPTHNYAGLSFGNVASLSNAAAVSNPRAAAKQGLQKAKALADMGMVQGMLAPQERPDLHTLRRIGFTGTDAEVLNKAAKQAPALLRACCSASSMWTANAATVSPSADCRDGKLHFTPANLVDKLHRSIEPITTGNILAATFNDEKHFSHHQHLPEHASFGDEGAANHTRLCREYGETGVELFVYGQEATNPSAPKPKKYPARQTLEASQAIARLHQLDDDNTVYISQNPDVIDQGVFHNDVIAVGNQNVLFYHEQAFLNTQNKLSEIKQKFGDSPLHFIEVPTNKVGIQDAVKSYLFNTQIITLPSGEMAIIAPTNCQENEAVHAYLQEVVTLGTPIKQVHYFDVKQSMQNGGGPACLRLRVAMNDTEVAAVNQHTLMNDVLFSELNNWVDKHYRDRLSVEDLADPQVLIESRTALDELTQLMQLGSVYQFQK
ncbi:N-succinylarginine dihydrolase [Shewanella violacea]|uniref:N-succinylarginine dihydrolase n=1 Tax=Shewanella violacea (strain JCM 10179 / CIP 106290 / LMG 19151 / DSS12) TaxID=637905 RepID=D4ZM43_SHEVD|nr:N-succinylarginine dihydrolase [Shewanella violacea]BAJ02742.1 succinylarginine dihydrolase [Shewanella violacea DSS12]